MQVDRRTALRALGWWGLGMAGLMTTARRADATVVRAVSVEELVRRSHGVLVATPLERMAEWARVGGTRRIVTLTRVRVEETVAGVNEDSELLVRTLGGRIGDIGQLVDGEAELRVG